MKLPLFFLFALCISKATAFGLYGCYERLLYWQAYQMDEDSHNKKIATACARDSITAKVVGPITGGRCNLRQFLYYITDSQDEKAVVADKNTLKDSDLAKERTDLDEVAKKMYHAGMGEPYNPSHIYQGLRSNSQIHDLIQNVAGFIQRKRWLDEGGGKPAQELFDQAERARSRVQTGRIASGLRDVGVEIRRKYDREVWDKQPKNRNGKIKKNAPLVDEGLVREQKVIPPGATEGWISCNPDAAQDSLNAAGKEVNVRKEFIDPWKNNQDGHRLNIQAVQDAKQMITEC
ncbi:hypothetical protein ASPVEDRAFT_69965 [Aspergillus versicolor CBS 583.65]|uniref:Uncharacterized protein n=1 Tax=Aspergillus versicolor CBS 583.65 TaxID=1036611 RepID=A0A1L9PDK3_ASPVE|nr:uncharacterized protein ASPVEDRAFT_69965 [Aspergillus versicolor CBS 583.65]OJI99606.1 hypothetical protein ASPVEDRAFT_69965 [Aspergillus versicolor CBS 583.65]